MISIVVPVYNAEDNLSECLRSLSNQSSNDFEIILVDDGSIDSSGIICDNFADECPNVSVIHTTNQGALHARRIGVAAAKGEYITFVDSDDCIRHDAIELINNAIYANGCDIISYGYNYGYTPQFDINRFSIEGLEPKIYIGENFNIIYEIICTGRFNSMCNKAFLSGLVKETMVSYDAKMCYGEDFYQLLAIINRVKSLQYIDEALYFCRENQKSSSHNYSPIYIDNLYELFSSLKYHANLWGGNCPSIAHTTMGRICYAMIVLIGEWDASTTTKKIESERVLNLLECYCSSNLSNLIAEQSLAPKLVLRLLVQKHFSAAWKIGRRINRIYNSRLHLK